MYVGKKRRDSRHWWRRIQSRKYRRVLIIKSILLVMVTAIMYMIASKSSFGNGLCLLAWCLVVGIILIPFKKILRGKQSKESSQAQQILARSSKHKEFGAYSKQSAEASISRIKEVKSKTINTRPQQNVLKETS